MFQILIDINHFWDRSVFKPVGIAFLRDGRIIYNESALLSAHGAFYRVLTRVKPQFYQSFAQNTFPEQDPSTYIIKPPTRLNFTNSSFFMFEWLQRRFCIVSSFSFYTFST